MKDSLVEEESSMEDGAMLQTGAERSSFTPPSGRSSWPGGRAAGTRNLPSLPPLPSVRALPLPSLPLPTLPRSPAPMGAPPLHALTGWITRPRCCLASGRPTRI